MFLGKDHHSLDSKDRLTVPSRFREGLSGKFYLTLGLDKNLLILTQDSFAAIYESLQGKSLTDVLARNLRRLLLSNACELELDGAGRIIIPKTLREMVNITNEAVLVGAGDYLEVWAPEEWQKQMQILQDEANAERFATLELVTRRGSSTSTLQ